MAFWRYTDLYVLISTEICVEINAGRLTIKGSVQYSPTEYRSDTEYSRVLCSECSDLTRPYTIQHMATRMALREPHAFLDEPGEPNVPWTQWFSAFETYIIATGGESFSAQRKKAILLHCLGFEGQRIYNSLPPYSTSGAGNVHTRAVHVLGGHFKKRVNVVALAPPPSIQTACPTTK